MAIRKVSIRSCDRCGVEPAEQCTVNTPETGRRFVDLCAKHRAELVELAGEGTPGDRRRTRSYTREQVARMAAQKAEAGAP